MNLIQQNRLKTKIEYIKNYQDTCIKDIVLAKEALELLPSWKADEDWVMLLKQQSFREGYKMGFEEGCNCGVQS